MEDEISRVMQAYIDSDELAQAVLIVRQDGQYVYKNKWGFSRLEDRTPVQYDSVFRMMSMSKVVTALCVLKLAEQGKLDLNDPVEKYLPFFRGQRVAAPGQYRFDMKRPVRMMWYMLTFSMDRVKTVPAQRPITVRDLLSHTSGLEQGMVGLLNLMKNKKMRMKSLKENAEMYSRYPLDFQPGTDTNYSPLAGFNVLGYLVSEIAGEPLESFMQREICAPLEMKDTSFFLNGDMRNKLVDVYRRRKGRLVNVTGTDEDLYGIMRMMPESFEAGAGGLYSTAEDYGHLAEMLLDLGVFRGKRVFREETVEALQRPGAFRYLEKDPGLTWGLGVMIRMDPERANSAASAGTYGWSGAFGTHFFVSPADKLEAVFLTNRSDLDGAASPVSKKVEELVFGKWRKKSQ